MSCMDQHQQLVAGPAKAEPRKLLGRPPVRRREVAEAMRDRIRTRVWKPGERLSPRRELTRDLG